MLRLLLNADLRDYSTAFDALCYSYKASNPLELLEYEASELPVMVEYFLHCLANLTYL